MNKGIEIMLAKAHKEPKKERKKGRDTLETASRQVMMDKDVRAAGDLFWLESYFRSLVLVIRASPDQTNKIN
jgi:hypothetical protein